MSQLAKTLRVMASAQQAIETAAGKIGMATLWTDRTSEGAAGWGTAPQSVALTLTPVVAPEIPDTHGPYLFVAAYYPMATGESPIVFQPVGYPKLTEANLAFMTDVCDYDGFAHRAERMYLLFDPASVVTVGHNGAYLTVAESNIKDFLGGSDAEEAGARLSRWVTDYEAFEVTIRESLAPGHRTHLRTADVLLYALNVIHLNGWVSRGAAKETGQVATAEWVEALFTNVPPEPNAEAAGQLRSLDDRIQDWNKDGDIFEADTDAILAWLREQAAAPAEVAALRSPYLHNLIVLGNQPMIELRHVGLICSAPGAYSAYLDQKRAEAIVGHPIGQDAGAHYGAKGDRVEADVFVDSIENRGENEYGVSMLVKLHVVPTGEELVWWTGESLWMDEGKQYHVRMSIGDHNVWDGRKQTRVSRVSEYDPPPPKPPKEKKPAAKKGKKGS